MHELVILFVSGCIIYKCMLQALGQPLEKLEKRITVDTLREKKSQTS